MPEATHPTYSLVQGIKVLNAQRRVLASLRETARDMVYADLDVQPIRDQIRSLQATVINIDVPCILRCGASVVSTYVVDDPSNTHPNSALCGACSSKLDDEAAAIEIEGESKHG